MNLLSCFLHTEDSFKQVISSLCLSFSVPLSLKLTVISWMLRIDLFIRQRVAKKYRPLWHSTERRFSKRVLVL
jgi:hypothetical protein